MKVSEKIEQLKQKRAEIEQMGGEERVAKQHAKGKLTARERINLLFDEGTFREIDKFVKHRAPHWGWTKWMLPQMV